MEGISRFGISDPFKVKKETGEMNIEQSFEGKGRSKAGFAFWSTLVFIIFLGLIAAVVMKLMLWWVALLVFIAVVILAMILASLPDIIRYMRISSM
jgi:membrane protein YdbS with pleckstrin-like domain